MLLGHERAIEKFSHVKFIAHFSTGMSGGACSMQIHHDHPPADPMEGSDWNNQIWKQGSVLHLRMWRDKRSPGSA